MGAYDGHTVRPWHLWGTPMALFSNQTDNGHIRVKLLAKGDEYLEERPGTYDSMPDSGGLQLRWMRGI
jgi:hypothetical protein